MKQRVVFSFNQKFKDLIIGFIVFISLLLNITNCLAFVYENNFYYSQVVEASKINNTQSERVVGSLPNIKDLFDVFFGKTKKVEKDNRVIMVYPGGFPLGFTMNCNGVIIVSIGDVLSEEGIVCPAKGKNIKVGDVLYSVNGETIQNANHLQSILNTIKDSLVEVEIHRGSEIIKEKIEKVKEVSTRMYRLGLWIRDNTAGVGTLTYVRQDNFRFGALGHPVSDIDTGKVMPVSGGSIYKCNIVGYNKGFRGTPGELRGLFLRTGLKVGSLDNNNNFGVYGVMQNDYVEKMNVDLMQVGFRDSVKTGKATILSTIDGGEPTEYDIEIIKLNYQTSSDKKSMVIRITDERLLNTTGGIVQGMSGSPIIQNGKLVGAVTHVFVSDPTKGFGVYIDWMIDN